MRKLSVINIRAHQGRRAFSSLELFAALTISAILGILAVSAFRIIDSDLPLDTTAQRFNHMASTARAYAIGRNSIYTLQIDANHGNFWVDETNSSAIPINAKVIRPEPIDNRVIIQSITYGGNVQRNNQLDIFQIRFFPDGSCDDSRIVLRAANPRDPAIPEIRTVRIYGPTGHSKIFDGELI